MTGSLTLTAEKTGHRFGSQWLFRGLSFSAAKGEILIVKGRNGSGKSTLLRISGTLLTPSEGKVSIFPETGYHRMNRHLWLGYCAPGMNLYGDLSGIENLNLALKTRGKTEPAWLGLALADSGMTARDWNKPYKSYSSGMKQRARFLASLLHQPEVLLLDEPFSNLDRQGKLWIRQILPFVTPAAITLIASNDEEDFSLSPLSIRVDRDT
ncbi:MAG: ATP-binding cassette domain-containing protein [Bacteroidetes bacterium]|nr:ATP-binding cassette domain-containing protein [Bacteroidota bacterium]